MRYILILLLTLNSSNGFTQKEIVFSRKSSESLFQFLDEKALEFSKSDIAVLKDVNVFSAYNTNDLLVVPEAFFFDSKGYRIKGFKGLGCGEAIKKIDKLFSKKSDPKDHVSNWFDKFSFLESSSENGIDDESYDVFVIIHWATFLSDESQTSLNWYRSLKNNSKYKIRVVLLSLDIHEDWTLTEAHKKALKL
ncbi:MAG: hypothetical protein ACK4FS_03340 [Flavobacterium sp.]